MLITDADRAAKLHMDQSVEAQAISEQAEWQSRICRVCSVENGIERIKKWSAIGPCPICGAYSILFDRRHLPPAGEMR